MFVVRACRLSFFPEDITQAVLEIIRDDISAPISEVACRANGILLRSYSHTLNCLSE